MVARPSAVAGSFYPDDPRALRGSVAQMLAEARGPSPARRPKGLIVPHAGYLYSGPIAATAYAQLLPWAASYQRVVVLGPAHRVRLSGVATVGADQLLTPLGSVDVTPSPVAPPDPLAHAKEHSLEVQLPFLQVILHNVEVLPLLVGVASAEEVGRVLESTWGGPETLILISSDLSHYLPYAPGRAIDQATIARILAGAFDLRGEEACGAKVLNGLGWLRRRRDLELALLDLRSSGDTAGDRDQVVGYAALAIYEGRSP